MTRETFKSKVFPGVTIELMDDFSVADAEVFAAEDANSRNRPQKAGAIERYAEDMIRNEWDFNGEGISQDKNQKTISGRNRSKALLKAEKLRKANPDQFREEFGLRGPIKIPMMVVRGLPPKVFRSVDSGEKRSGRDMCFCSNLFDHYEIIVEDAETGKQNNIPEFNKADKKKLAGIIATAARTVWLRLGGKDVSDAPKFPPSALQEFIKKHPHLIECVVEVYRADAGGGAEQNIASLVSPAYMAAVMYLASTSKTSRSSYDSRGTEAIKTSFHKQALAFVESFAVGSNLATGSPVLVLRQAFTRQIKLQHEGKGRRDRDVILNMLILAFRAFLDDKTVASSELRWNSSEDVPRLGGLDIQVDIPVAEEEESTSPEEAVAE